jgi:hypothetical protein
MEEIKNYIKWKNKSGIQLVFKFWAFTCMIVLYGFINLTLDMQTRVESMFHWLILDYRRFILYKILCF